MTSFRRYLTASNILAATALFMAMSGSAVAASLITGAKIKNGSIKAVDLGNNSVTSAKIKKNAVTGTKVKNGAVTGAKLGNNSVTSGKIKNGAVTMSDLSAGVKSALQGELGAVGAVTFDGAGNPTVHQGSTVNNFGENPSASRTGVGVYEITIPGYTAGLANAYNPLATISSTNGRFATVSDATNKITVRVWDVGAEDSDARDLVEGERIHFVIL